MAGILDEILKNAFSTGKSEGENEKPEKQESKYNVPDISDALKAIIEASRTSAGKAFGAFPTGFAASSWNIDSSSPYSNYSNYYLNGDSEGNGVFGLSNSIDALPKAANNEEDTEAAQKRRANVKAQNEAMANIRDLSLINTSPYAEDTGFNMAEFNPTVEKFADMRNSIINAAAKENDRYLTQNPLAKVPEAASDLWGAGLAAMLATPVSQMAANEGLNREVEEAQNKLDESIAKNKEEQKSKYWSDELQKPQLPGRGLFSNSLYAMDQRLLNELDEQNFEQGREPLDTDGLLSLGSSGLVDTAISDSGNSGTDQTGKTGDEKSGQPAGFDYDSGFVPTDEDLGEYTIDELRTPTFDENGEVISTSEGNRFQVPEAADSVSKEFLAEHQGDVSSYFTPVSTDIFNYYQDALTSAAADDPTLDATQYDSLWDFQLNCTPEQYWQFAQFANTCFGMYDDPNLHDANGNLDMGAIYDLYDWAKATYIVGEAMYGNAFANDFTQDIITDYQTAIGIATWLADQLKIAPEDIKSMASLLWTGHMSANPLEDQGLPVYSNAYDLGYMDEDGTQIGEYSTYNPMISSPQYSAQGRMGDFSSDNPLWSGWTDLGDDDSSTYKHQMQLISDLSDPESDLNKYLSSLIAAGDKESYAQWMNENAALQHYIRGYGYNQ